MNIIVDAYGGDNAPLAVLQGAALAVAEFPIDVTLAGNSKELKALAEKEGISLERVHFLESETIMPVEVQPSQVTGEFGKSSMAVALQALAADEGDVVVSAGSTGALVIGSTLWVKRIRGVRRPSLGILIPSQEGFYLLIDGGANAEVRPEMLQQFGIMGSVYMKQLLSIENPRVGMVNIGTEPNKGLDLQIKASALLAKTPLNFIGNIEARDLPLGGCDVAVTDGFTGNIILKLTEGMAAMFMGQLKKVFYSSTKNKIAAALLKNGLKGMAKQLDASEYGGVPLLGIRKPVIKAHGSSDGLAIKNAIRQGIQVKEQDMISQITQALEELKEQQES